MKIYVLNYQLAAEFIPTEPTIVIRIFDPHCDRPDGNNRHNRLKPSPFYEHVFEYTFEDIDLTCYDDDLAYQHWLTQSKLCFTPEMAQNLLANISGLICDNYTLMVHCNAGISRSVAVVNALIKRFGITPEWGNRRTKGLMGRAKEPNDYVGNRWVYRLLMEA